MPEIPEVFANQVSVSLDGIFTRICFFLSASHGRHAGEPRHVLNLALSRECASDLARSLKVDPHD